MHGNAWEWVQDCARNNYNGAPNDGSVWEGGTGCSRILRGGGWDSKEEYLFEIEYLIIKQTQAAVSDSPGNNE